MPGIHTLHQVAEIQIVLDTTDIGNANATSKYMDMGTGGTIDFMVRLGTTLEGTADGWNAADTLDSFKLRQATQEADAGSDVKDITGATVTAQDPSAAGERYVITLNSEQLDSANDFRWVAAYVAEDDDTGADWVTIVAVRYNLRYSHRAVTVPAAYQQVG